MFRATFLPFRSATPRSGESLGTRMASLAGAAGSLPTYTSAAPAAWAKIGGASPTVPKSIEPTFRPSSNCGPAGNSVHFTVTPCSARRLSSVPNALTMVSVPYF